jgi:serine protease Do
VFETPYSGPVYVLDAMTNNPGAAGGVLTNIRGELAGILGKELRNSLNNTWLNYAIPVAVILASVDDIIAGKILPRTQDEEAKKPPQAWTLSLLGLRLVPDVLPKTPPFIDHVAENSPAARAGLKPDDLILFVNGRVAASCKGLAEELSFVDRIDPVRLTVQRGQDLLDVSLEGPP